MAPCAPRWDLGGKDRGHLELPWLTLKLVVEKVRVAVPPTEQTARNFARKVWQKF